VSAPPVAGTPGPVAEPAPIMVARAATGLLRSWNEAGILEPADVHVALRCAALVGEPDESVQLALALLVRAARSGSTCLELALVADAGPDLPAPDRAPWLDRVRISPLCGDRAPMRADGTLLYLDRYWHEESQVCTDLLVRDAQPPPSVDLAGAAATAQRLIPDGVDPEASGAQRAATVNAAVRWTTVLAGGPGTGKTTTVAKLLAVLADQPGRQLRMALAAPTGKAAARLTEAVAGEVAAMPAADGRRVGTPAASTLHRLLGYRPGSRTRFRHDRENRLPYDVVVVDEASMVSLTMMARLLEALRPDARLILVGDPDQLTSVEAGAVLADLVSGLSDRQGDEPGGPVVRLRRVWRFGGAIAELAQAVRIGDAGAAVSVLERGDPTVGFGDQGLRADVVGAAVRIRQAAEHGDGAAALMAMQAHRLVCGHRTGPDGVNEWTKRITGWLADDAGLVADGDWYLGRPLLITENDYSIGLFNGDTGVVVRAPDGALRAVFLRDSALADFAPSRLAAVETVHAMTVHRSQGSQFDRVSVVLPALGSPLLTRELFYTAVTRARGFVRVIGTADQVRAAVTTPAARATGLRRRLAEG
jgi:exodeoxyribonuclease V alpha subunit